MSLSHPEPREQFFRQIHMRFMVPGGKRDSADRLPRSSSREREVKRKGELGDLRQLSHLSHV
jgi:hypothetical protein